MSNTYPLDKGRKLNVRKSFRGRHGGLLNVLCTLNLRPVSRGILISFKRLIKIQNFQGKGTETLETKQQEIFCKLKRKQQ